jgi:hypothetical protein
MIDLREIDYKKIALRIVAAVFLISFIYHSILGAK